ncbi:DUF1178 family protein [Variovorax sp. VNK109]|jgi:hypothetical protein|uniref:DUF1178 family protein n=1 Tax=Variovorax sp. VNK109 TaxID=3400919 RepID=UPI003C0D2AF9
MKVLNLHCTSGHAFEGWFASEDDFQSQHARGLVTCPMCGDAGITKGLSAPRLNLRGGRAEAQGHVAASDDARQEVMAAPPDPKLQAAWFKAVRELMAKTEDVGERFADEARRMHYGEAEERNIRGQATAGETRELLEEGISVLPLALPEALKGPLQ